VTSEYCSESFARKRFQLLNYGVLLISMFRRTGRVSD